MRKNELRDQTVETIYLGGGTPSLLSIDELQELIDSIYKNYMVSAAPEISLEANPDDLSRSLIDQLSKILINRLSIGIQSFFDEDLISMNRAHSAHEAMACLEMATEHFENLSIDLIYGIPNMSLENGTKIYKKHLTTA